MFLTSRREARQARVELAKSFGLPANIFKIYPAEEVLDEASIRRFRGIPLSPEQEEIILPAKALGPDYSFPTSL